jgi:hypothetical protein
MNIVYAEGGVGVEIRVRIGMTAGTIIPTGAKGEYLGLRIVFGLLYPGIDIVIQVVGVVILLFRGNRAG